MNAIRGLGRIVAICCTAQFSGLLVGQSNAIFQSGAGDGHTQGSFSPPVIGNGIFTSGAADGYALGAFNGMENTAGVFNSGPADGYARGIFGATASAVGIFTSGIGDGYSSGSGSNVKVSIQGLAMLEGPYNTGTLLMNDNLRSAGLVPLTEPYSTLGYANAAGSGGETTTAGTLAITGAGAVVDWVRVELRDAAVPATLVAARHALVVRAGSILDPLTGDDFISLNAPPGNYFVVVRHRNHLGVMTAAPIALTSTATEIDFTLGTTATFGTNAQKSIGAVNVLWTGDVTGDHQLKYTGVGNDRDPILVAIGGTVPTNTLSGQYRREDINLDGVVKYTGTNNDRDPILVNIGGAIPTATRIEQVP